MRDSQAEAMYGWLVIVIPGPPVGQGRPRATHQIRTKGGLRRFGLMDPEKSRAWKNAARGHYVRALMAAGAKSPLFPEGPVELAVLALFPCPLKERRKREPVPRRVYVGSSNDWDNIGKAVSDAGNGLLWSDDGQVVLGTVARIYAGQDEEARVIVRVRRPPPARISATFPFDFERSL